jgi:hypothetical protein
MQRIKIIGLALLAAFAISAVASASAWAGPQWLKGGTLLAAGEIVKFTGTSGAGTLETDNGNKVKCTSDTASGQAEGEKAVSAVKVTFEGCTGPFGEKCGVEGKITSELLSGELVYLDAAHTKIGLLLKGTGGTKLFSAFTCGFAKVTVKGEVIGEITPVNSEVAEGKLKYKMTAGEQEWHTIGGAAEPPDITLETEIFGSTHESAIESEDTVKWEGGAKVSAMT